VDGVDGLTAAPSVGVFLTFDLFSLIGFRAFLVLIFALQAAVRGSSFNRTIYWERARL
jgi:UDP-N-acetylmuramyl pentapeptide phosphotransferase/UDP-N-acetylglucosamine-1-phosphate transferase